MADGTWRKIIIPFLAGVISIFVMIVIETDVANNIFLRNIEPYEEVMANIDESERITKYEYENEQIDHMKGIIRIIDYSIFLFPLMGGSIWFGVKSSNSSLLKEQLGRIYREMAAKCLSEYTDREIIRANLNIRFYKITSRNLTLCDHEGFYAEKVEGKMMFNIKRLEGAVVKCKKAGSIVCETDNCLAEKYNLSTFQRSALKNTKFLVAIPIVDRIDKVVGVVSLDSCDIMSIKQGQDDNLADYCAYLGQRLYNDLPGFFRRWWIA